MAADSMAKASSHKKLGPGPLWHTPGLQLPAYIQHVAARLMSSQGLDRSRAIATAVAIIKRWASGAPSGGEKRVDATTVAAARKALAEWEAAKAKAHATSHTTETSMAKPLALAGTFNSALHPHQKAGSPTGGQFAPARNAQGAAAQKDPKAAANYGKTLGAGDAKAQIAGMSAEDLIALSKAAYSFKSNDPKVVALRIAIANEIAKRGGNVNDYGGLGKGTPGGPKPLKGPTGAPAPAAPKPAAKKTPAKPAPKPAAVKKTPAQTKAAAAVTAAKANHATLNSSHTTTRQIGLAAPAVSSGDGPAVTINAGQRRAMAKTGTAMPDGSFPIPDRHHLRKAIKAVGRAHPTKRAAVKAHIRKRAKALGVDIPDGAKKGT